MPRFVKITSLALLGLALTYTLSHTSAGHQTESFVTDRLLRLRHSQAKGPKLDPRVLILEVDEATYKHLDKPMALWLADFAGVLQAVFDSGASLAGFDIILTYAPNELLEPFLVMLLTHPDKLIMASFYDPDLEELVTPDEGIRAVLGDQYLALTNITEDKDGVLRRQSLTDYQAGGRVTPFFARALYEQIEPNKDIPSEVVINFVGPDGTFPRISMAQVLQWIEAQDEASLQQTFQGKIVLLGPTAKADQDFKETPFSSVKSMAGIEIHANVLNTLLTDQPLRPKAFWLLFGLCLLPLSWAALEKPLAISSALALALSVCWLGGVYLALVSSQLVAPAALAWVGILACYGGGYLYRFNTVEKERRRIQSVFGRYVSPDVMEAMLETPEDHKPELAKRQRVTVMFSDINDFSTACEKLEPEEVTRRLNLYFGEMTNIIYAHQGTIIRFIGDEFMVLFGAPKENDKSEEMAVLAAVRMVQRLKELCEEDPLGVDGGFYEVKIGIHVGEMILTSIGNELRSDYNCIGDSTNMAARVLSLTKPLGATVLISEDTKKRVECCEDLEFNDLGVHPVKGRAGEVRVFEAFLRGTRDSEERSTNSSK